MTDRITFRLGSLLRPLASYCEKNGTTPSDAIRLAVSRLLRVEAPEMDGHVEAIQRVNAAKRSAKRKRRK
jgi:hypothetical protein